jgi:hypothetical protein
MAGWTTLVQTLIAVMVGATMQYWLSRAAESRKQIQLLQSQCYVDYLKAVTKAAHARSAEVQRSALADTTDAKTRISVYGTPAVIAALARFEESGAVLDNPRAVSAFVALVGAMRQGKAKAEDLKLVLFSAAERQ